MDDAIRDRTDRDGEVLLGVWVPKALHRAIRHLAWEEETTNKALLKEALSDLFAKRGRKLPDC
jgi:hypothetical protein